MIANCKFVSVWDGGVTIVTNARYNKKTESFEVLESVDAGNVENLEEEYLEFPDGSTISVCTDCHEGVLKTTMEPNMNDPMDKTLYEVTTCTECGVIYDRRR